MSNKIKLAKAPNRPNISNNYQSKNKFRILPNTNYTFLIKYLYNNQKDKLLNINFHTGYLLNIFRIFLDCKYHSRQNKLTYNIDLDSKDLVSFC